ncbi:MAG: STAS domain-containing protein [Halieaceae bacterium]
MEITSEQIGAVTVARLSGDLDTGTSAIAGDALIALLDEGAQTLLVNLEAVGFVSSAGLRILLTAAKRLSNKLRVCGLNETVQEVFDISGFTSIFDVYDSEQLGLDG